VLRIYSVSHLYQPDLLCTPLLFLFLFIFLPLCYLVILNYTITSTTLPAASLLYPYFNPEGRRMSTSDLSTPPKCVADFCLIPLGTPTASISPLIADVQRLLLRSQGCEREGEEGKEGEGKEGGGLRFSMHSAGTTVGALRLRT
jgi:uncharacterized protein YqgV (UPF0045/DUF77 family)